MRHLRRDNVLGLHQTRRFEAAESTASGLEDDGVTFACATVSSRHLHVSYSVFAKLDLLE